MLKTQYTAVLSWNRMIMLYAHDKSCYMPLIHCVCNSGVGTDARECAHRYPFKTSSGHLCAPTVEAVSSCDIVTCGPSESESFAHSVCRHTTSDTNAIIAAVGLDRWISWDCPNKRSSKVLREHHFHPCPPRGAHIHIYFQTIIVCLDAVLRMVTASSLRGTWALFTYTKFCGQTKRVLRTGVFSVFRKVA